MITKTLKTSDGNLKVTIPSDIKEMTIGLLMALTPPFGHTYSPIEQLSILSGIPSGKEDNLSIDVVSLCDVSDIESLNVFDETLQKLAYQLKAFVTVQAIPDKLLMPCIPNKGLKKWFGKNDHQKLIPIISNLGISPAGAYMEAKEVIRKDIEEWNQHNPETDFSLYNPKIESLVRVLSLYLYVPATGEKFSPHKAAQFDEVIKKLYITDALPIARHFFLKYPNLSKPKVRPSLRSLKQLRSKQV